MSKLEYSLCTWEDYFLYVKAHQQKKNDGYELARLIMFEIRNNNMDIKPECKPKSAKDIFTLPGEELEVVKVKKYKKPSRAEVEELARFGINLIG